MDKSCVINLISTTRARNDYGVWTETDSSKQVFAQVSSVSRAEFFDAGRNGLNPEYQFTMFSGDYSGEETLEYEGKLYGIYRTYLRKTDVIELYAERKGKTHGNQNKPAEGSAVTT